MAPVASSSRRFGMAIAVVVVLGLPGIPAAQVFDQDFDVVAVGGSISDIDRAGDRVYVGGSFTCIGPFGFTGAGVPFSTSTGMPLQPFLQISGTIAAVVADGAGGWYIGGTFSSVGGLPRQNLAHIQSDLSVSDWNPGADGIVRDLARAGLIVFVAGDFGNIGGAARPRLAAISTATGLATSWRGTMTSYPTFFARVATDGVQVFAAGPDPSYQGAGSAYVIAAFDATSPGVTPALWRVTNSSETGRVMALAVSGPRLYVGGALGYVGGIGRSGIAALETSTGAVSSWRALLNHDDFNESVFVSAIMLRGSTVVLGGNFDNAVHPVTLQSFVRHGLVEVDTATAVPTAWNPAVGVGDFEAVFSIAETGSVVYVGGDFTVVNGQPRNYAAAIDSATAQLTAWDPTPGGAVHAISVSGVAVFVGGGFNTIGCMPRRGIASFDATTGEVTDWNPGMTGFVNALEVRGSTVYLGGSFGMIGGAARNNLAAIDAVTGVATSWNPTITGAVTELATSSTTVYVCRGSAPRALAFDIATGSQTGWNPNPNLAVSDIEVGPSVYLAGQFTTIGGASRNRLAAVDPLTGIATSWDPNANGIVTDVEADGATVYAGGQFTFIGSSLRNRLAAFDVSSGLALPWDPDANANVNAIDLEGSIVYVGGDFTSIGGQSRNRLASLNKATGAVRSWDPGADGGVSVLRAEESGVYAAGSFGNVGGLPAPGFAAFDISSLVGVEPQRALDFALSGAHPNPTLRHFEVSFSLPDAAPARLELLDIAGRRIGTHEVGALGAGSHSVRLAENRTLSPGVYLIRLSRNGQSRTARAVVIR
jgi:trimeric autotransporter adhesin